MTKEAGNPFRTASLSFPYLTKINLETSTHNLVTLKCIVFQPWLNYWKYMHSIRSGITKYWSKWKFHLSYLKGDAQGQVLQDSVAQADCSEFSLNFLHSFLPQMLLWKHQWRLGMMGLGSCSLHVDWEGEAGCLQMKARPRYCRRTTSNSHSPPWFLLTRWCDSKLGGVSIYRPWLYFFLHLKPSGQRIWFNPQNLFVFLCGMAVFRIGLMTWFGITGSKP